MSDDTGGSAFPFPSDAGSGEPGELGMTLRDYFAAKAMQGLLASGDQHDASTSSVLSEDAYKIADAMLKVRNKK